MIRPLARSAIVVGPRDLDILAALDRHPLTAEQLATLSVTFAQPFTSVPRVRGRLLELIAAKLVRRWHYATTERGGVSAYYRLSPQGFRVLHGPDMPLPSKRSFHEIGIAFQHHARSLSEFLVAVQIAAHAEGWTFTDYYRENQLRIEVDQEWLVPDAAFALVTPGGESYHFVVELDCSSERVRTLKDTESFARKIRLYDAHQDVARGRFRVVVVTTRSRERMAHLLGAAAVLVRNAKRSLFVGVYLPEFLATSQPLTAPIFRHQSGVTIPLVVIRASAELLRRVATVAG